MANEFGNLTYGDTSRREDLTDLIANISPTDTPFTSGISHNEPVRNTLHEWQQDVLASRASNAYPEGHTSTYTITVNPSRLFNVTQILRKDGSISNTRRAVDSAGFKDKFAYEQAKKTKEFKNDLEYSAVLQTLNTGASGTARQMKGAVTLITSNVSALSSAALSETIYNDFLELTYIAGGNIDEVYVGSWLKRKISSFSANSQRRNVPADDRRLINRIDTYDSDFGLNKIFKLREFNSTGASTAQMIGIQSDQWRLGWLRRPKMNIVPPDGSDASKFYLVGEVTLICGADGANFKITGLDNAN